ncbi:MAG: hypothetical protein ABJN14_07685 [Paracoccaceae bacterium]
MTTILIAIDLALVALYVVHVFLGSWPGLLSLDGEGNFGAWWGGAKLFLAAAAVAIVPLFAPERMAVGITLYLVLAIGLAFLSADEILMLHERITSWNKANGIGLPMFRGTNGAWVFVYLTLFAILFLALYRSIFIAAKADIKSAALVGAGFAVLISGGVIAEVLGYYGFLGGMSSPPQVLVEEGLELVGVSILLLGCIHHAGLSLRS